MENLPVELISGSFDLGEQTIECRSAGLVVERQSVDVLQNEVAGLRLCEHRCVCLEETRRRIVCLAFPVEPKSGFREGDAGRTAYQQVGALLEEKPPTFMMSLVVTPLPWPVASG